MSLPQLKFISNFTQEQITSDIDGVIYILDTLDHLYNTPSLLKDSSGVEAFKSIAQVDEAFGVEPTLVHNAQVPGSRAIVALTGSLNYDVDDVRIFYEVANKATQRALKAGIRNPAFIIKSSPIDSELYKRQAEVALLGALEADYESLVSREHFQALNIAKPHLNSITLAASGEQEQLAQNILELVKAIETGKRLSKDLGGSNQERMTPLRFAEYIENAFSGTDVEVQVIREVPTIEKEYPLLGAVARSSKEVPKHHPTVIKLNYRSPKPEDVKENLFFVGKGVCFDTGGADLKVNGVMRGMSSDKCGAASVAGFLLSVAHLKPTNLNITASLAMVINSIGPNAYLCDEIITSRAGKRVLIANTDAEGRMAMTDLLAEAKELALAQKAKIPEQPVQLFTVATLTGHAVLAVGPYSIALDNGPARKRKTSQRIFDAGLEWGDIFEVSTLRREDFKVIAPGSDAEDVIQSGTAPSSRTCRGHQFPAAFMITASGLDKHGLNASQNEQIPYTHLDIAGGSTDPAKGWGIERANGRPLASLLGAFIL